VLNRGIRELYVRTAPSAQNAVDLFAEEWSSRFLPPFSELRAGPIPLYQDSRLTWALQVLGGCQGQRVLELGPLEGGHSYMLEPSGAEVVTAIEANSHAFLKCLIAKEILGITRVRFQLGDFVQYLEDSAGPVDLIIAAGVLYHMREPLRLIRLLAERTNRVYFWTHYYDHAIISNDPNLRPKFRQHVKTDAAGFPCVLHRQEYQGSLQSKRFCGGADEFSFWLERADILTALQSCGFRKIEIAHEQRDHPHGPCFSLAAAK
jgi:hypothetical protein